MSNYQEERSDPSTPTCGPARSFLYFNGDYLVLLGPKTNTPFPAVSGSRNDKGLFDYSVERQKVPFKGPIPEGDYWIQPSQMWENGLFKRGSRIAWGNFRLTIHPYPATATHGRGGFFIHGGSNPGSAGCIDLTMYMDKFVEKLKQELEGLPECYVALNVDYSKKR